MKRLLCLPVLALLATSATACGGAIKTTEAAKSTPTSPATVRTATGWDNGGSNTFDGDDDQVRFYGHEADARDRGSITSLLGRYYAAAARADGAGACRLIHSLIAETVAENSGEPPAGPERSCAPALSRLFGLRHRQLAVESATLRVRSVRVGRDRAFALLHFATTGALPNKIQLHREGRAWKLWEVFAGDLP